MKITLSSVQNVIPIVLCSVTMQYACSMELATASVTARTTLRTISGDADTSFNQRRTSARMLVT